MIEAAINGMLTSLDPHSSYMNAEAVPGHERPDRAANSAASASR